MRTRYSPARCCCGPVRDVIRCGLADVPFPKMHLRIDAQIIAGINNTPLDELIDVLFTFSETPHQPAGDPLARYWHAAVAGARHSWVFEMGCHETFGPSLRVQAGAIVMHGCHTQLGINTVAMTDDPFFWGLEYRSGCGAGNPLSPWTSRWDFQISEP